MQFYGALDAIRSSGRQPPASTLNAPLNAKWQVLRRRHQQQARAAVAFGKMSAKDQRAYLEAKGHSFD
jgi:hypothetical protein